MEPKARFTREEFAALEDDKLIWACAEPFISPIRGKSPAIKQQVFHQLTEGQQALYLFQIMDGHTRSVSELYWFSCDYLAQTGLWAKMKQSVNSLGCYPMLAVYERIEDELGPRLKAASAEGRTAAVTDLERDPLLFRLVAGLLNAYREAAGDAIRKIADRIRKHPEDYASLEEADSPTMV